MSASLALCGGWMAHRVESGDGLMRSLMTKMCVNVLRLILAWTFGQRHTERAVGTFPPEFSQRSNDAQLQQSETSEVVLSLSATSCSHFLFIMVVVSECC